MPKRFTNIAIAAIVALYASTFDAGANSATDNMDLSSGNNVESIVEKEARDIEENPSKVSALYQICRRDPKNTLMANLPHDTNKKRGVTSYHVIVPDAKDKRELELGNILYGALGVDGKYDKIGFIKLDELVKNTPEVEEIKKKRIAPGTGKYWILVSKASRRAERIINMYGQENGFNFITADSYFAKFVVKGLDKDGKEVEVMAKEFDVTKEVIQQMNEAYRLK